MKIPQFMFKKQHGLAHPNAAIKDAARALEIEAYYYRREKNTAGSNALRNAARALREVADGKTWAEAFEFTPPSQS